MEELPACGFDFDCTARSRKLFSREESQRCRKFVPQVDKVAVQDAWSAAQKAATPICVFLMGSEWRPSGSCRTRLPSCGRNPAVRPAFRCIPVDVRDWSAHIPADAPAACQDLIKRLREAGN